MPLGIVRCQIQSFTVCCLGLRFSGKKHCGLRNKMLSVVCIEVDIEALSYIIYKGANCS